MRLLPGGEPRAGFLRFQFIKQVKTGVEFRHVQNFNLNLSRPFEVRWRPKRHPCHCAVNKQPNQRANHKCPRLDNGKEWKELILRMQQS
jgi:hypothetical protein